MKGELLYRHLLAQFNCAFQRRTALRAAGINALRLVDNAGDGLPGLELDDFAGRWLVQTCGGIFPPDLKALLQTFEPAPVAVYWKKRTVEKAAPVLLAGTPQNEPFAVEEHGLRYLVDFTAGYSQGLFLDQRDNRRRLRELVAHRLHTQGGASVLNTFAYTCAFGVAAATAGATTLNLDLSRRHLEWGRRNYALNGLDPAAHDFLAGDVFDWLPRFLKKGRRFDFIVLDPPSFARGNRGRIFTIETHFSDLVRWAAELLAPGGALLCTTNLRRMGPAPFRRRIESGLNASRPWRFQSRPMPPDFTGEPYLKTWWVLG